MKEGILKNSEYIVLKEQIIDGVKIRINFPPESDKTVLAHVKQILIATYTGKPVSKKV